MKKKKFYMMLARIAALTSLSMLLTVALQIANDTKKRFDFCYSLRVSIVPSFKYLFIYLNYKL